MLDIPFDTDLLTRLRTEAIFSHVAGDLFWQLSEKHKYHEAPGIFYQIFFIMPVIDAGR
jgi:hypothetical protein